MSIQDFVYYPRLGGYKFTELTCAFAIEARQNKQGMWIRRHQCDLKPKYEIDGYKFCIAHKNHIEAQRRKKA